MSTRDAVARRRVAVAHPHATAGLHVARFPNLAGHRLHGDSLLGTTHTVITTVGAPIASGLGSLAGLGLGSLASAGLDAVDGWVLGGARAALEQTADVIGRTTAPELSSTWFSSEYWHVAGLAAMLTLPFLFAAAVQALVRSEPALLARAAFMYLPLALLGVGLATPLTMLMLAATDQMCAAVSAAGGAGGARFLASTAAMVGGTSALAGSGFLAFAAGLLTVAGALMLALEMLIREAAVYVVVLMLPLTFAAFVWPARRIWAIRMVELLTALILSKFAVVAVLSLAGAAFGATGGATPARLLTAMALVTLSAFAPWGIVRLLPFTELAAGAGGEIRSTAPRAVQTTRTLAATAGELLPAAADWPASITASMADHARDDGQTQSRGSVLGGSAIGGATVTGSASRGSNSSADAAAGGATAGEGAPTASEPSAELGRLPDRQSTTWTEGAAGSAGASPPVAVGEPKSVVAGGDADTQRHSATGTTTDPAAGTTTGTTTDPAAGTAATGPVERRPPSIDPLQAPDWSWKPVHLGLHEGWPPRFGPPEPGEESETSDRDGGSVDEGGLP